MLPSTCVPKHAPPSKHVLLIAICISTLTTTFDIASLRFLVTSSLYLIVYATPFGLRSQPTHYTLVPPSLIIVIAAHDYLYLQPLYCFFLFLGLRFYSPAH